MKQPEEYIKRAEELIELANKTSSTQKETKLGPYIDNELFSTFLTSSLSFILNLFGESHPYYQEFYNKVDRATPYCTAQGRGILTAIRDELSGGWFFKIRKLVSGEIFSDILDMAKYLLDEGYKDPAAVMIGCSLEAHLRQLCFKYDIEITQQNNKGETIPKKADTLNNELAGKGAYDKLEQKNVTAWLDIRNKAAHGQFDKYTQEHISLLYANVLSFISRISV